VDRPISMKFDVPLQISVFIVFFLFKDGHVTKYQNIVNSKWQTAAILKIVFWLYLQHLLSD